MIQLRTFVLTALALCCCGTASAQVVFAPGKVRFLDPSRHIRVPAPTVRGPFVLKPAPESTVGRLPENRRPANLKIESGSSSVSARYVINPNNGVVYREVRRGGKTERNYVDRARLLYKSNGRPYYDYRGVRAWAFKPWRQPQNTVVYPSMQHGGIQHGGVSQNPPSNPLNHQQGNPAAQIVGGIFQIIANANRN